MAKNEPEADAAIPLPEAPIITDDLKSKKRGIFGWLKQNLVHEKDPKKRKHFILKLCIIIGLLALSFLTGIVFLIKNGTTSSTNNTSKAKSESLTNENGITKDSFTPFSSTSAPTPPSTDLVVKSQKKPETRKRNCYNPDKFDPEADLVDIGINNGDSGKLNQCFFNSILQVLYHDRQIRSLVAKTSAKNQMASKLVKLFHGFDGMKPHSIAFPEIKEFLPGYMCDQQQQDAHEALNYILGELVDNDHAFTLKYTSEITYEYKKELLKISEKSRPQEFASMLSLAMPSSKSPFTMQNLINYTFETEDLELSKDDIQRGLERMTKTSEITELPETLIIHLIRNHFDSEGPSKIKHPVKVSQIIELPDEKRVIKYRLRSFVLHVGETVLSGHYTAYVRAGDSYSFTHYNDETITEEAKISGSIDNAYIYFYERI